MRKIKLPEPYTGIKDANQLIDMLCFRNWVCGNMGLNIPVDESRSVYDGLKKMILEENKKSPHTEGPSLTHEP